jgi:hypothetical protein
VIVDRQEEVHVLYQERFAKAAGARNTEGTWVHYVRFKAGEIEQGGRVRHVVLNDRPKAMHPDLAVDRHGNALVVWEEGTESLVLLKIKANGLPAERHLIKTGSGSVSRAFPAIAADWDGKIHLAWTDTSNSKIDRMVHTVLDSGLMRPVTSPQTLYSVPSALGQRKVLTVESSGRIRLAWTVKQAHGRLGEMNADQHHLLIQPGAVTAAGRSSMTLAAGSVTDLVDRHLHAVPVVSLNAGTEAIVNKPPFILPPDHLTIREDRPERKPMPQAFLTAGVEKRLKRQVLEFSSWSGAPPSGSVIPSSGPALLRNSSSVQNRPISENPAKPVLRDSPSHFIGATASGNPAAVVRPMSSAMVSSEEISNDNKDDSTTLGKFKTT